MGQQGGLVYPGAAGVRPAGAGAYPAAGLGVGRQTLGGGWAATGAQGAVNPQLLQAWQAGMMGAGGGGAGMDPGMAQAAAAAAQMAAAGVGRGMQQLPHMGGAPGSGQAGGGNGV
jgi:hypothetical protein